MTNLNYLEADAALIVACLPEEIDDEITKEQLPLFYNYALLMRAKGVDTQLEDVGGLGVCCPAGPPRAGAF